MVNVERNCVKTTTLKFWLKGIVFFALSKKFPSIRGVCGSLTIVLLRGAVRRHAKRSLPRAHRQPAMTEHRRHSAWQEL